MRPPPPTNINMDMRHLSSLIQLTSNSKLPFTSFPSQPMGFPLENILSLNNTINANFCINNTTNLVVKPRKFSEDNVLIHNHMNPLLTQFAPPHKLDDLEILTKKVKKF